MGCGASKADASPTSTPYDTAFEVKGVKDIDGKPLDLEQFEGKVLMVVNIATKNSRCAAQLKELAEVQEEFGPLGLEVLLFPSDDFNAQPIDTQAVKAACDAAGFKGQIMEFAHVKGPDTHPLWLFLQLNDPDSKLRVGCDLTKYIVNKKGGVFGRWGIGGAPHVLESYIKRALGGTMTHQGVDPKPGF